MNLNQARLQALLAYLVLKCTTPQTRQHLAFLFWPDSSEGQAYGNLRKALHALRKAVPALDGFLQIKSKTVQWRAEAPLLLDVAQFELQLIAAAQATDAAQIRFHLEAAVGLYTGDLLLNCYDDWIALTREQLRDRFLEALTQLCGELEQAREYPAAIRQANRLLRVDPLHEQTYQRLMRLHMLQGDRAAALRTYHICATTLRQELDVTPNADTQQAYAQLLRLEPPSTMRPPLSPVLPRQSGLVGRKTEWQNLLLTWQRAAAGQAQLVLIVGEAGIGKTRLAEELLWWASHQGAVRRAYACLCRGRQPSLCAGDRMAAQRGDTV